MRGTEGREAIVQLASGVERDWLTPTHTERRVWVDDTGRLRAMRLRRYDSLTLQEQPDALQADDCAVLVRAWQDAPRSAAEQQVLARIAFAGIEIDVAEVLASAAADFTRLDQIDIEGALPWDIRQRLLTDAPPRLPLPSGRTAALAYEHGRVVRAAVKLQELFGLAETPRIGPRRDPVVFDLLAPNGRSVQTTQDLRSFWTTTYPEVRRELRARYPRHPWPDDPDSHAHSPRAATNLSGRLIKGQGTTKKSEGYCRETRNKTLPEETSRERSDSLQWMPTFPYPLWLCLGLCLVCLEPFDCLRCPLVPCGHATRRSTKHFR